MVDFLTGPGHKTEDPQPPRSSLRRGQVICGQMLLRERLLGRWPTGSKTGLGWSFLTAFLELYLPEDYFQSISAWAMLEPMIFLAR